MCRLRLLCACYHTLNPRLWARLWANYLAAKVGDCTRKKVASALARALERPPSEQQQGQQQGEGTAAATAAAAAATGGDEEEEEDDI